MNTKITDKNFLFHLKKQQETIENLQNKLSLYKRVEKARNKQIKVLLKQNKQIMALLKEVNK